MSCTGCLIVVRGTPVHQRRFFSLIVIASKSAIPCPSLPISESRLIVIGLLSGVILMYLQIIIPVATGPQPH